MTPRLSADSSRAVLMIRHMAERGGDLVAAGLRRHGCALQWCCPAEGSALPGRGARRRFAAVVVYGGAQSANDEHRPYISDEIDFIADWVAAGRPLFGVCLGAQLLGRALGARVRRHEEGLHEIGYHPVTPASGSGAFLDRVLHLYQWHNEGFDLPPGTELLATGQTFENQAFRAGRGVYGVQFHPEVTPAIIRTWFDEAGDDLSRPGAHSARRQLTDVERFDEQARQWIDAFLTSWIGEWD